MSRLGENEDNMQTGKITWKENDKEFQPFIKFAEQCSSISVCNVRKYHSIQGEI